MGDFTKGLYFAKDGDSGGGSGDGEDDPGQKDGQEKDPQEDVNEWDAFHDSLPAEEQKLIADRDSGLKTALDKERDARKGAEKDLRDVAKDLKDGSDAQEKVLKLADQAAAETQKADFYEDAHGNGIANLKLAFHVVQKDDLFDSRGNVDFKALKEDYPELFVKKVVPPGDAGDGTGTGLPGKKVDMNALIRQKAGR